MGVISVECCVGLGGFAVCSATVGGRLNSCGCVSFSQVSRCPCILIGFIVVFMNEVLLACSWG